MRIFFVIFLFTQISTTVLAQKIADVIVSYPFMLQKNTNGIVDIDLERFAFSFNSNTRGYLGRVGCMVYNTDSVRNTMVKFGLIHSGMRALNPEYSYFIRYGFEYVGVIESGKYYSGALFNVGIKLLRKRKVGILPEYNLMYSKRGFSSLLKFGVTLRIK